MSMISCDMVVLNGGGKARRGEERRGDGNARGETGRGKVATVEEVKAAMEVDWKVVEVRVVGARAVEVRAQDTSRQ